MGLGHEKRDVYRLAIGDVAWGYEKADGLTGKPIDPDPDSDNDLDETTPQQRGGGEIGRGFNSKGAVGKY